MFSGKAPTKRWMQAILYVMLTLLAGCGAVVAGEVEPGLQTDVKALAAGSGEQKPDEALRKTQSVDSSRTGDFDVFSFEGQLANAVSVTGVSGPQGDEKVYSLDVPLGQQLLVLAITGGGIGQDADIYVKFGSPPTTSVYDCRPYTSSSDESCTFWSPNAGTWYVMVRAYTAYANVSLTGEHFLDNGIPVSGLSDVQGGVKYYVMNVHSYQRDLLFQLTGPAGAGDADLYVKFGTLPTTSVYDCRPYSGSSNESCYFPSPAIGKWYVMISGYTAYSGVSIQGSIQDVIR